MDRDRPHRHHRRHPVWRLTDQAPEPTFTIAVATLAVIATIAAALPPAVVAAHRTAEPARATSSEHHEAQRNPHVGEVLRGVPRFAARRPGCLFSCRYACATMSHMETIGIRELRRYASRWLARVNAGETFLVTDRGRPIARLSPVEVPLGYEALLAEGRIAPGSGGSLEDLLDALDADLPPDQGPSVTEALLDLRAGER
jgi:prevent-host-death family protein